MTEPTDNRPFNSGRRLDISTIEYKTLHREMLKAHIRPYRVSIAIGVDHKTMMDSLRGYREWKLWEAVEIKKAIGSDMPLEELFKRG